MEDVVFEFYRGDTYTRDFTISGWSLPISNIFFTVKETEEDKNFVFQKTLNNGITIVDEDDDTVTYNIEIYCTDTDEMKANTDYVFDVEIHSESDDKLIKKTIITGTLNLTASATRTCNE